MSPKLKSYVFPVLLLIVTASIAAYLFLHSSNGKSGLSVIRSAPDFQLKDLNGKTVQASENTGKVVLMEFMFTSCPDICPVTTYKMVQLQNELKKQALFGSKVRFVAVTFDPENDTPEVLRKYADRMGMDPEGWQVLRGEEKPTHEIAAQYGVRVVKTDDGQFVHNATSLQLIDAGQKVRKVYSMGEELNIEEVMADINALLAE